jgi:hypothetical protein
MHGNGSPDSHMNFADSYCRPNLAQAFFVQNINEAKKKHVRKKFLSCALFYDGRHLSGGFVIYGRPGSTGGVGCGGVGGGGSGGASFPLSMRLSSQLIN